MLDLNTIGNKFLQHRDVPDIQIHFQNNTLFWTVSVIHKMDLTDIILLQINLCELELRNLISNSFQRLNYFWKTDSVCDICWIDTKSVVFEHKEKIKLKEVCWVKHEERYEFEIEGKSNVEKIRFCKQRLLSSYTEEARAFYSEKLLYLQNNLEN